MMNIPHKTSLKAICTAMTALVIGAHIAGEIRNPIEAYVHTADSAFEWQVTETIQEDEFETVLIDMTSQRWLTEVEVNRPLWQHRLVLTVPNQLYESDIGFLYIGGGSNNGTPSRSSSDLVRQIALATQTVVAELKQVPNQPLVFHNDGEPRYEDNLIAYAWMQYLRTGKSKWLPRNAMVKSAVRAMDVISAFMQQHQDGANPMNRFVVGGGSKRGWTTWLTGAMDDRVVAVVPIVIDVLNVDASMRHHFAAYGFWAPAISDYVRTGIMEAMGTMELAQLYELADPLNYVRHLKIPQFVVNAAGDQFFLPDSSQFYWDQLSEPKYLRYVPNADHGLGDSDGSESVAAFHYALTRNIALPKLRWHYLNDRQIDITFDTVPNAIELWEATNSETRDFRMETFGPGYMGTDMEAEGIVASTTHRYQVDTPPKGWKAWYLELTYDIGFDAPLKLSTPIRVTPEQLPFEGKPPNLPLSLTFVLFDLESSEGLFDAANALLKSRSLGSNLSIIEQRHRTYLNFVPTVDPRLAYAAFENFLRSRFGDDLRGALQLESGTGATLAPL